MKVMLTNPVNWVTSQGNPCSVLEFTSPGSCIIIPIWSRQCQVEMSEYMVVGQYESKTWLGEHPTNTILVLYEMFTTGTVLTHSHRSEMFRNLCYCMRDDTPARRSKPTLYHKTDVGTNVHTHTHQCER